MPELTEHHQKQNNRKSNVVHTGGEEMVQSPGITSCMHPYSWYQAWLYHRVSSGLPTTDPGVVQVVPSTDRA